jgi:UDPglucose 6-dehydrogenase
MLLVTFGVGYVGLVTGTGLAELGHDVLCVDIDPKRVRQLKDGIIPIYEPGLGDLVRRNERAGRLHFDTKVTSPFHEADAYFVAVGTPPGQDGGADIRAVLAAGDRVAEVAKRKALIVVKSTVPVGTCDALQSRVDQRTSVPLEVVSNPEFLKEGSAVQDFFRPDRIVLGARSDGARETLRALYAPLQLSGERVVVTDPRSSELTKYAANTMLAMRVSFMNELARLCHATGADVHAVRLGVGSDTRIGKRFLYAGPGYGGSCFPKDVQALMHLGRAHGVPMRMAEATHLANEEQAHFLAQLVEQSVGTLTGKTIALWGLAFKPETDDIRESPAMKLAAVLLAKGATVACHDPEATKNFAAAMAHHGDRVRVVDRDYEALNGAHALVLLTEWRSYRAPNFAEIRKRLMGGDEGGPPVVIDARNVWRPGDVARAGLRYQGIGVPTVSLPASASVDRTVTATRR